MNQMHKEIDYEVNAGLEQLSRGLENTKNLASEMNREIDDQNEIITDITSTTNLVSNRIEKQNDSLQNVLKKHSTCGLWIMVVLVSIITSNCREKH
ncbi:hypothetical protein SNEBB_004998 [Seison nebaliae]|nr:hypothetical protein SNEBB_004998 [Seison nebaliae]